MSGLSGLEPALMAGDIIQSSNWLGSQSFFQSLVCS